MTDPDKWHEQFPVTRDWIYLDIANKAPLPLAVMNAWHSFLDEQHRSPGDKDSWKQRTETLRAKTRCIDRRQGIGDRLRQEYLGGD